MSPTKCLQACYKLFMVWHVEGKMHPSYVRYNGDLHLMWLLGHNANKWNLSELEAYLEPCGELASKFIGEHGYAIYRAACARRDTSNG